MPRPPRLHIPARLRGRAALHVCLAGLSAWAGVIHLQAAPDHLEEYWLFGGFFALLGAAQVLWSMLVVDGAGRRLYTWALVGNLAVVGLWALSRSVGVPIGPEPWHQESIGAADLIASLCEMLLGAGCAALLASGEARSLAAPVAAESRA